MKHGRLVIAFILALVMLFSVCAYADTGILTIPYGTTSIADGEYAGSAYTRVILPEGLESIGSRAFADSSVKKINIPASVNNIAADAFDGCSDLFLTVKSGTYGYTYANDNDLSNNIDDPSGILRDYYLVNNEISTFNVHHTESTYDANILVNCYDTLCGHNSSGQIVPELATSWYSNEDATEWFFTIRDDVKWVDCGGNYKADLSVQDFLVGMEWTLNYWKNSAFNTYNITKYIQGAQEYYDYTASLPERTALALTYEDMLSYGDGIGISERDGNILAFTCIGSVSFFPSVISGNYPLYPLSGAYFDDHSVSGYRQATYENVWYCGPYYISSFEEGSGVTLEKNLYWYGSDSRFETIEYKAAASQTAAYMMYVNGEIDMIDLTEKQINAILSDEDSEYRDRIVSKGSTQYTYSMHFCYDVHKPDGTPDTDWNTAVANYNFRQALYYGLNPETYIRSYDVLSPYSAQAQTYTSSGLVTTSDGTDYTQLVLDELQLSVGSDSFARYDGSMALQYKNAAKAELSAAGVTLPVQMHYYIVRNNLTAQNYAERLADDIEKYLGTDLVVLDIQYYTSSLVSEVRDPRLASVYNNGWGADYADPYNFLAQDLYGDSSAAYSNYYTCINDAEDPGFIAEYQEYTRLVNEANEEVDDYDERLRKFAEAEAYLVSHALALPIYTVNQYCLTNVDVDSYIVDRAGNEGTRYVGIITSPDGYTEVHDLSGYEAEPVDTWSFSGGIYEVSVPYEWNGMTDIGDIYSIYYQGISCAADTDVEVTMSVDGYEVRSDYWTNEAVFYIEDTISEITEVEAELNIHLVYAGDDHSDDYNETRTIRLIPRSAVTIPACGEGLDASPAAVEAGVVTAFAKPELDMTNAYPAEAGSWDLIFRMESDEGYYTCREDDEYVYVTLDVPGVYYLHVYAQIPGYTVEILSKPLVVLDEGETLEDYNFDWQIDSYIDDLRVISYDENYVGYIYEVLYKGEACTIGEDVEITLTAAGFDTRVKEEYDYAELYLIGELGQETDIELELNFHLIADGEDHSGDCTKSYPIHLIPYDLIVPPEYTLDLDASPIAVDIDTWMSFPMPVLDCTNAYPTDESMWQCDAYIEWVEKEYDYTYSYDEAEVLLCETGVYYLRYEAYIPGYSYEILRKPLVVLDEGETLEDYDFNWQFGSYIEDLRAVSGDENYVGYISDISYAGEGCLIGEDIEITFTAAGFETRVEVTYDSRDAYLYIEGEFEQETDVEFELNIHRIADGDDHSGDHTKSYTVRLIPYDMIVPPEYTLDLDESPVAVEIDTWTPFPKATLDYTNAYPSDEDLWDDGIYIEWNGKDRDWRYYDGVPYVILYETGVYYLEYEAYIPGYDHYFFRKPLVVLGEGETLDDYDLNWQFDSDLGQVNVKAVSRSESYIGEICDILYAGEECVIGRDVEVTLTAPGFGTYVSVYNGSRSASLYLTGGLVQETDVEFELNIHLIADGEDHSGDYTGTYDIRLIPYDMLVPPEYTLDLDASPIAVDIDTWTSFPMPVLDCTNAYPADESLWESCIYIEWNGKDRDYSYSADEARVILYETGAYDLIYEVYIPGYSYRIFRKPLVVLEEGQTLDDMIWDVETYYSYSTKGYAELTFIGFIESINHNGEQCVIGENVEVSFTVGDMYTSINCYNSSLSADLYVSGYLDEDTLFDTVLTIHYIPDGDDHSGDYTETGSVRLIPYGSIVPPEYTLGTDSSVAVIETGVETAFAKPVIDPTNAYPNDGDTWSVAVEWIDFDDNDTTINDGDYLYVTASESGVYGINMLMSMPGYRLQIVEKTLIAVDSKAETLIIPANTTMIEEEAFAGSNAKYVVIPESVWSIGARAFADMPRLEKVYIPYSVNMLDETAFDLGSVEIIRY